MYGVTKVVGELLCDYYALRFDVDARGRRLPGLISYCRTARRRHHRLCGGNLSPCHQIWALHVFSAGRYAPRHDVYARRGARHDRAHGS